MPEFLSRPVDVVVPASSANLGPGFDALALALTLTDKVRAQVTPSGLDVDVEGVGSGEVPRDESHLVVTAMRAAFDELGGQPSGLSLRCVNRLPHARGLGSSSAAIVAGIVAARAVVADGEERMSDDDALVLATRLEGHPDNVAAALFGGLTLAWSDADRPRAVRLTVSDDVRVVVFVPPAGLSTATARGLLPERVPHADAARSAGRAALLVAALAGRPELLLPATRDWLHQPYRETAMPASSRLVLRLRSAGVAAVISGAGPSVLAFEARPRPPDARLDGPTAAFSAGQWAPPDWQVLHLGVDTTGARLLTQ